MLGFSTLTLGLVSLKNEPQIEQQILNYLTANPAAQDTLRGITEWWLFMQRIQETESDIEAALNKLVANGKLARQVGSDGQVIYRLRKDTLANG